MRGTELRHYASQARRAEGIMTLLKGRKKGKRGKRAGKYPWADDPVKFVAWSVHCFWRAFLYIDHLACTVTNPHGNNYSSKLSENHAVELLDIVFWYPHSRLLLVQFFRAGWAVLVCLRWRDEGKRPLMQLVSSL